MNAVMKPIAVYDEFRAQLADLKAFNDKATFDYEDEKGNKEARSHVYKLRQTKAAVDRARKTEKQASLDYGRRVDSEAKAIIGEIEAMIDVHQKPLDAIEQREKARIANHEDYIAELITRGEDAARDWQEKPVEALKALLATVEVDVVDREEYAERVAEVRARAVEQIKGAIARREQHDAEQAELEKLRAEAAAREQKERDEQIAREAQERAAREAEEKAARERQEAADREARLKLEKEQAEAARLKAEQDAKDAEARAAAKARADAEAKAKAEAAELARREADQEHRRAVNRAAVAALVQGGVNEQAARQAIFLIASGDVPAVKVHY